MNSARLKEIMAVQSKAGVGRLELNFETAFEVVEALEQAEQAITRVREVLKAEAFDVHEYVTYKAVPVEYIEEALDGDGRG